MAQVDFSNATLELYNTNDYGFLSDTLGFWNNSAPYVYVYATDPNGTDYMAEMPRTCKIIEKHPDKVVYNYTGSFKLDTGSYRYKDRVVLGFYNWGAKYTYLVKNIHFETGDTYCFDVVVTIST